jgi:hypothetical protein
MMRIRGYGSAIRLTVLCGLWLIIFGACGCKRKHWGRVVKPPAETEEEDPRPLKMVLLVPAEIRGGQHSFALILEIQEGTLYTENYTLQAIVREAFNNPDYSAWRAASAYPGWYKILDNMNGKSLKDCLGKDKIVAGKSTKRQNLIINKEPLNFPRSCKLEFAILDKTGKSVAGPLSLNWTF